MGFRFPQIVLLGTVLVLPLVLRAGGGLWPFFLPPEPDFGLLSLAEGAPFGDDDDRGSFVVEGFDSEDGNSFWANWTLARFFVEGETGGSYSDDDSDTGQGEGNPGNDDDVVDTESPSIRLIPAFRTELNEDNLLDSLPRYLWLGLDWQEIEGVDLIYPEYLVGVYPYLRLYDYEPRRNAWIDPEFIYYFVEQEEVITARLNGLERTLYLAARAQWMDAFMSPEDALQAWGELACHYADSSQLRSLIERLLHTPWQESAWCALSESIGGVYDEQLRIALAHFMYAKFLILHGALRFSACMPWLLELPGLLDDERTAVRNYLRLFIREQVGRSSAVVDRVHDSILLLLSSEAHSDAWLPFLYELFEDNVYEGSVRGYLFLLRAFYMLEAEEELEMLLLNKIALLLYGQGDNARGINNSILMGIVALMKESMLSEKAYSFCLELLCTPCSCDNRYFNDSESRRINAIGSLLSFTGLSEKAFQRLWGIYYLVLRHDSLPLSAGVLQALPAIICSEHLSEKNRMFLFNRLKNEEAFDGAYLIDSLLDPRTPGWLVEEGLPFLVGQIERQPSDAFWDTVKGRLSALLSLLCQHEGRFQAYHDRIIDALNAIVNLRQDRLSEVPSLVQLREDVIEVLLKHYAASPERVHNALTMLEDLSLKVRDAVYVSRLWRWLFVEDVLDEGQIEEGIEFLLTIKEHFGSRFPYEGQLLCNALVVPLSSARLSLELRFRVLRSIYKTLDLRSAVTLLLKGVSWVQEAKVLYGLAHNVARCEDARQLRQLRIKLIYSGYFRHKIQQAFTVRHCDAVALRYLHAAKQLLNALGSPELMDLYLEEHVRALSTMARQGTIFPEFSESAEALLWRMQEVNLVDCDERCVVIEEDDDASSA